MAAAAVVSGIDHTPDQPEILGYESVLDFRQSCKNLLKAAKQFEDAGRVFTQFGSTFADELLKHVDKIGKHSQLAPSLVYFGNTIVAVMSVQEQMINEINSNFQIPLSNFVDYDFAELAELKRKCEKAKSEYDTALVKIRSNLKKKHDSSDLVAYEKELDDLKGGVTVSNHEMNTKLQELNSKRETKFLRYLSNFMGAQNQYFARGTKLFQNLKPRMDAIQEHIAQIDIRDGVKEGHLVKRDRSGNDRKRYYFVLKAGWLYSFKGKMELDEKNALNILLCSVKIPLPTSTPDSEKVFEVMNPAKKHSIILQAETEKERDEWVAAIQEAISSTLNAQTTQEKSNNRRSMAPTTQSLDTFRPLKILQEIPGNTTCADCQSPDPDWASINLGILVCKECSGVHRSLGTHISKVRSLTLDKWAPESLLFMKAIGNQKLNEIFEQALTDSSIKPNQKSDRPTRERWIKAKYQFKEYLTKTNLDQNELNQKLLDLLSADTRDLFQAFMLVCQGASTSFTSPEHEKRTALHQCILTHDDGIMVEFLLQNGADMFKKDRRGWTPAHYAAYFNRYRSAKVLLTRGFESSKDRTLDMKGRIPLDLAILNGSRETEALFRGADSTGEISLDDVEKGVVPELALSSLFVPQLPAAPDESELDPYDEEYEDDDPFEGMGENSPAYNEHDSPRINSLHLSQSFTNSPTMMPRSTTMESMNSLAPPFHKSHSRSTSHDGSTDKKKKRSFFGRSPKESKESREKE